MLRFRIFAASTALLIASPALAQEREPVRPAGIWYGAKEPLPRQKGALRLATYNVENLFDDKDDPENSIDQDEMTSEDRLRSIAAMIRKLDADVLCLQEVESKECLAWFRDKYLDGLGYEYIASEDTKYSRGIEQSVLSRVPIRSAKVFTGEELVISDMEDKRSKPAAERLGGEWSPPGKSPVRNFQRSPLQVELATKDGYELTVFVVHFKAGGKDFGQQRELEALQTEEFVADILRRNPDANVAVLGDFNATPNDMPTKVLRQSSLGFVSAYDWRSKKEGDSKVLKDLYTTHASGRPIDFIVMTPGLAADCVDSSYFVLGTLHPASDWDYRKADEFPPPAGYASDHCPVAIDFMTDPDRPARAFRRVSEPSSKADEDRTPPLDRGGRGDVRSDAVAPTEADLAKYAKPEGAASRQDQEAARKLRDAGWEYMLPYPKSKAAAWSKKGGTTTWWPGYWRNTKLGTTSRSQPDGSGLKGDGKPVPAKDEYTKSGAPGRVTWVEWLCSVPGTNQ